MSGERPLHKPSPKKLSTKATLVVIGFLIGYALLQPSLENRLGRDLPSFVDDSGPAKTVEPASTGSIELPLTSNVGQPPPEDASDTTPAPKSTKPVPKLGELRDIGGKVLQSTAGLRYRPGSQEGHRVKHVLRHHEDDPERPIHGVFDGDTNEVFAVIDEAYLYTFDHGPPRVTQSSDQGRTIYVVDLGRKIGYIGGQRGQRDDHPSARHVQLVLEGTNVITAYPVRVNRGR